MKRHALLTRLHELLRPRTYFEIGVRTGGSLELSRTSTVAVDPVYEVQYEVQCDLHLVRTTSDEFFAREHPFAHFPEPVVDLAFIDGMHQAEYALRDFVNTERFCHPGSVVVFDDVLPRNVVEANRKRASHAWAGDVYKAVDTIRELRPDLVLLELDTEPTGTLVVLNPDPTSRVLTRAYDRIVPSYVTPDPQPVPEAYLTRARAIPAERLVDAPIWETLVAARRQPPAQASAAVRRVLESAGLTGKVAA